VLQLAHLDENAVRAAYNHALHLKERRLMMQAWADYLDTLRKGYTASARTFTGGDLLADAALVLA
jgi:hypothetical protein